MELIVEEKKKWDKTYNENTEEISMNEAPDQGKYVIESEEYSVKTER